MPSASPRAQAWALLLLLALVWGSSYILITRSLVDLSPAQVGHLRLAVAGLSFLPAAVTRLRLLRTRDWPWLFVIGLCGTGLPSFLFPFAQMAISSSLAAAISALVPLMTLLVAVAAFGLRLSARQGAGILVGLVGALLVVGGRYGWGSLMAGGWPLLYIGAAFLATCCYALSSNVVKAKFPATDALAVSAGAFLPLGVYGLVGTLAAGDLPLRFGDSPTLLGSYAAVLFLGLIGTALASYLFFRLVQLTEPVFASTVSYLVPVVAFAWGVYAGEVVTATMAAALVLILGGVYLTRRG